MVGENRGKPRALGTFPRGADILTKHERRLRVIKIKWWVMGRWIAGQ